MGAGGRGHGQLLPPPSTAVQPPPPTGVHPTGSQKAKVSEPPAGVFASPSGTPVGGRDRLYLWFSGAGGGAERVQASIISFLPWLRNAGDPR